MCSLVAACPLQYKSTTLCSFGSIKVSFLGNQEKALSVSCLEYEPTIPAKFMIGTDQGMALGLFQEFHLFVQDLKHWKSSYFHLLTGNFKFGQIDEFQNKNQDAVGKQNFKLNTFSTNMRHIMVQSEPFKEIHVTPKYQYLKKYCQARNQTLTSKLIETKTI